MVQIKLTNYEMKIMKIKIKHDRVRMCTTDANLAIMVLSNLTKKAIIDTPGQSELEEEAAKLILDKVKKDFKTPTYAPALQKQKGKKTRATWTVAEDLKAIKLLDVPTQVAQKDKFLRQRHTKDAIRARISKIRCRDMREFSADRGELIKKVLDGKTISAEAGTKELTKEEFVDRIKKNHGEEKQIHKAKAKHGGKVKLWTPKETQVLLDNFQKKPKELAKLIPSRTKVAIGARRSAIKRGDRNNVDRATQKILVDQGIWGA